jgi:hypothetical protein
VKGLYLFVAALLIACAVAVPFFASAAYGVCAMLCAIAVVALS